jgi:hypothetical protein
MPCPYQLLFDELEIQVDGSDAGAGIAPVKSFSYPPPTGQGRLKRANPKRRREPGALDADTIAVLKRHRTQQRKACMRAGAA